MSNITISLDETRYSKLANIANMYGKSMDAVISEIIDDLPEKNFNYKNDPLYNMEGYESGAPKDLSENIDRYIYE
mgnify:CR=1 FL=1